MTVTVFVALSDDSNALLIKFLVIAQSSQEETRSIVEGRGRKVFLPWHSNPRVCPHIIARNSLDFTALVVAVAVSEKDDHIDNIVSQQGFDSKKAIAQHTKAILCLL